MRNYLIIFDIDETLYDNNAKHIPTSTLTALEKLKTAGHTLAIATGRAPFEVAACVKELPFDFFILANGQLITKNETIIYENSIDKTYVSEIMDIAKKNNVHLGFISDTHASVTGLTEEKRKSFEKYYAVLPEITDSIEKHNAIYQMWYLSEDIESIAHQFKDRLQFFPWLNNGADVVAHGASKAAGLAKVRELLHGELPEQVVFFGDGTNDIPLMESCEFGVAMGNAVEALKHKAHFITTAVDCDGIIGACESLGLFDPEEENLIDTYHALVKDVKESPHQPQSHLALSEFYRQNANNPYQAISTLKNALTAFSDSPRFYLEIAAIYEFELEDIPSAKYYYEQVLKNFPGNEIAKSSLENLT